VVVAEDVAVWLKERVLRVLKERVLRVLKVDCTDRSCMISPDSHCLYHTPALPILLHRLLAGSTGKDQPQSASTRVRSCQRT